MIDIKITNFLYI